MVASTALRERGFAEAKHLCYAGLDAPILLREVARCLGRVVPFEAYCVTSNDPLSGLLTHMAGEGPVNDKEHFRTYLEHIYFEEDLDAQRRMVRNRFPVALLSEVTDGKLERALRCREITSPSGPGYELLGVCSVVKEQQGGICLLREPFHTGELQVAEGLELWPTLKKELLNFKRKIDLKTAHDSYEHWRESDHDDLVLACALACWWCRRRRTGATTLKVIY
jgi:hypothetical protein